MHDSGGEYRTCLEDMSDQDCVSLLSNTTTVGRIGFASSDGQQLLPVNFVFRGGRIYFKTSRLGVLAELSDGLHDVAFEIDYPDGLTQHGWSVVVRGRAKEAAEADVDLSPRSPRPWAPGERTMLIELTPDQISGKRIRRVTHGAGSPFGKARLTVSNGDHHE